MSVKIIHSNGLPVLQSMLSSNIECFRLAYVDPPFNTGKRQSRTLDGKTRSYEDVYSNLAEFLRPHVKVARELLKDDGSFFLHVDYRESHYCKVMLDDVFGRDSFMNEIIWAYDYGGRSKKKWSTKHDNIFWYAKDPKNYVFNFDEMDRIPYMAPGLVGKKKAAKGKTPTDVWWHTIVPTNGKEKTGYPTQKPRGILDRIVKVHTKPDDWVLDFFAGSGTTGAAATENGRHAVLVDQNEEAIDVMHERFKKIL